MKTAAELISDSCAIGTSQRGNYASQVDATQICAAIHVPSLSRQTRRTSLVRPGAGLIVIARLPHRMQLELFR